MIITYDAIDRAGRRTRDAVEAANPKEAVELLRHRGLFVTNVQEKPRPEAVEGKSFTGSRENRLPVKTLAMFTRQMAMLLRAGSAVVPAIVAIGRQMRRPAHTALLDVIVADLEEGATVKDALRKHRHTFDSVYCAIIAAGEASGNLTEMFDRLSVIVGKKRAMRKKIIGAFAYPALLVSMCAVILLVLLLFVLPRFANMFVQLGVDAPASTKALLATGAMVRQYWPFLLAGAVALGFGAVATLKSAPGRRWLSDLQIRVPVLGSVRSRLIQAQIFRTMGMLLESRVGLLDSLELARVSTTNNRFQALFVALEETVTSGGRLTTAFEDSGLIEPYICQATHTGEDSGNLGGALTYCADILDETNEELINVVTKLLEPTILIGLGLIVGGVAISLFLPLFDLTSALR